MTVSKRNGVLTWMQAVGCLLVIFGHSYPFVTEYPDVLQSVKVFIYEFHMPLFVFCSGVLLILSGAAEKYDFPTYLKRRAMRLLLPYFVLSLLGIVPKVLFSSVLNDSLHFDAFEILRAFFSPRNNIWGHFWFLPMIFFLGIFGYLLLRVSKKKWLRCAALAICFAALFAPDLTEWMGVDDLLHNAFYFVLGMCVSDLFAREREVPAWKAIILGVISFAAAVAVFLCPDLHSVLTTLKGAAIACLMIASAACLLTPLARRHDPQKYPILSRTFSIFILSWPCQLAVEVLTERLLHLKYYVIMPSMFLTGVIVPCVVIFLVDLLEKRRRHKPLTRLIGG